MALVCPKTEVGNNGENDGELRWRERVSAASCDEEEQRANHVVSKLWRRTNRSKSRRRSNRVFFLLSCCKFLMLLKFLHAMSSRFS
ncbi:unnamed protein product [Trifolium pratense]|uniref:Uncharacterized protein n=1 Tax=Trifolium pratense TaxID=57577 RepID=A0ACB0L3L2_TRIPR|nr:unnamed protein product [Trifolium pratense]